MPDHEDCSPLDVDGVAGNLMPGGTLGTMKGYEARSGQIDMLKAVGIHVNITTATFDRCREVLEAGSWDLCLCAFQMDVVPDFGFMLTPGNTHNFIRYNSTPMKELIADLREREDQAGFAYASQAIQQQFAETT